MRLLSTLETLAADAIRAAHGVDAPAGVRPTTTPEHGDYQVNGALPLAKKLAQRPRELATPIAERLAAAPAFSTAEVAGPGFVNLRLAPAWLAERLLEDARDRARDGIPTAAPVERVVVDFSSPNIAKEMHVGHLRSTIIGDAMVRILRAVGHEVIGDNHLGDWGTQYGLLIVGMREVGSEEALAQDAIAELERVYRYAAERAKTDSTFADAARAELARLQAGAPENRALWERFVAATRRSLEAIYARLGVTFDEWLGESAYHELLPGVVSELLARGIAREDDGALCVFFEDDPELSKVETPFIVRKKDGAFLYSTTDIATILYRRDRFHADRSVYVVDQRQSLHFRQLFAVARKLGVEMKLEHLGFGTVMGPDGKPLKTREGRAVTLASLLDEAEERARARIREEGLDVPEAELDAVARAVGIGAVRYADLRQNRLSDYQFDWDKMISFKGNAGPYLQYARARIGAIFSKGGVEPSALELDAPLVLEAREELGLAKQLLTFGDAVHAAAEGYPHLVADHLYALAREFSSFYEACPVLKSAGATRDTRLVLCDLTARQLERGLGLLGIATIARM
ncbi:MAG: arginine--tRNA ligase [Sorangiineae bacterium]|nr:arginine--tRNA ligase [Polyangiaceae bacterium]MEB2321347.1 arginine--tRNA ligase [Sorangiineae bacterium]